MQIDLRQRTATLRLLYAGPERATKFLNVRRLQQAAQDSAESLRVMHVDGGRVLALPVPVRPASLPDFSVRVLALATPGAMKASAVDDLLVRSADAVVFLPARDDPGGATTRASFENLVQRLQERGASRKNPIPVLVQDYADGESRLDDGMFRQVPEGIAVERVPVAGDRDDAVLEVFTRVQASLTRSLERESSARVKEQRARPERSPSRTERRPVREAIAGRTIEAQPVRRAHPDGGARVEARGLRGWADRHFDLLACIGAVAVGVGAALWVTYGG